MSTDHPKMREVVPLEAFLDPSPEGVDCGQLNTAMRPVLDAAEIVISRDVMTGHEALFYGAKLLRQNARRKKPKTFRELVITIDMETEELEKLAALMLVTKGRCDYRSCDEE